MTQDEWNNLHWTTKKRHYERKNLDIRETLQKSGVAHWELAEKLGLSASGLCVKLRKELPSEEKYKLFTLIGEIVDGRKVKGA